MTSRELVKKAINFENPPRLPKRFPECGMVDICDIKVLDDRGRNLLGKRKFITDEWGSVWENVKNGNMGKVNNAVIDDWSKLSTYKTPDPNDPSRYKGLDSQLRKNKDKYALVFNHFFLFERLHFLVGFTKLLESFYLHYNDVIKLADMIVDFQIGIIKNLSKRYKGSIDGMWTTEDWGIQTGLFISKEMWLDIFKPRYKIILDELKEAGIDLWFHSCGKINNIIEDLKDVGVKVINTYQPRCLGIEEIGEQFRGKICFETSIDMQQTIFEGNDAIKEEAYSIVKNWSTQKGGLIVTNYHHDIESSYIKKSEFEKVNKFMCEYFDQAFNSYYQKSF
jgi:uroporphyrinogen decarboxylase